MAKITETPLMKQYTEMKKKHPDAILLFRVGDFYEIWSEDAIECSEILGITLTRRANGSAQSIELAGFPHHALDTFLPRLVRAGKRVAICEQLKDGDMKKVEEITPGKQSIGTAEESKPIEVKEINCVWSIDKLRELGEPDAYFSVEIPRNLKHIGKFTSNDKPTMEAVCIQPELGKMIATDSHIVYSADVMCSGIWPTGGDTPFECFIDAKAITHLAGKTVDIAVWLDYLGRHHITACEAEGVRSQYQVTGVKFPNWRKVMPEKSEDHIAIAESELTKLRTVLKLHMGKSAKERECRRITVEASPLADTVTIRCYELEWSHADVWSEVCSQDFRLEVRPVNYIKQGFTTSLFYYSVQEDFDGMIGFNGDCKVTQFYGRMRRSLLLPVRVPTGNYMSIERPNIN